MTTPHPPFRAFRFIGAGFDAAAGGLATTAAGGVAMVDGDDSVRQAILLLLSTTPGERLMRPRYGSHLHRLVFAPNDHTTAGLAIHYVRQALERWEPRVEVLDVDAGADPDEPSRLNIALRYRVRATLAAGELRYPLDLGSGTTPDGGAAR
jgi:hypothetical protein